MKHRTWCLVALSLVLAACGDAGSPDGVFERPKVENPGGKPDQGGSGGGESAASTVPNPESIELVSEAPAGSPVAKYGALGVSGSQMVDSSGAPVQLRGISSMWLNMEGTGFAYNLEGLKYLRDKWNVSVIRAATPIDSPDTGKLSSDQVRSLSKKKLEVMIRYAAQLGIYILVDLHSHFAHTHLDEVNAFFTEIGTKYGKLPNLIYEPFNEPKDVSWSDELKPFFESVVSNIRKVSPNIVVLGTPNWSQRVDMAADAPVGGENIMYTLHFYACEHDTWLKDKVDVAVQKKLPIFVTEWGATYADGGVKDKLVCSNVGGFWKKSATELIPRTMTGDDWHTWMNEYKISWAAWKFDDCGDASCFFKPGTSPAGNWTDADLQGHGPYVVEKLLAP